MLAAARRHGLRVKMCIESFRHFGTTNQQWTDKSLHLIKNGGPARDIADFFDGEASRTQFRAKLAWLADRYGDNPTVFGWELWNEINAVAGGDYMAWSEAMLPELHRLFPRNLAMQSLGSFDGEWASADYARLARMPGNDVAQVHRYLDLGASFEVCHGPVSDLAADAVRAMLAHDPGRPVLLAESGAVQPSHTGPFELYGQDTEGVILHDVLFAPFFSGAAGPGHIWHWDAYVASVDLWHHFGRFATAIEGIDPPTEGFTPVDLSTQRLTVLGLVGRTTTVLWCRDRENTWETELAQGQAPESISDAVIDASALGLPASGLVARAYDPWLDTWTDIEPNGSALLLPTFTRSIVLRITTAAD